MCGGLVCRTIRVWKEGECVETLPGHEAPVQCLLLLPNGDFLSGSNDTTIKLWSNYKCAHTFPGHTDTVRQDSCHQISWIDMYRLCLQERIHFSAMKNAMLIQ